MFGMWRRGLGRERPPRRELPPGKYQAGYLWGEGQNVDIIGDVRGWHFKATAGKAIAYWSLWYGNREVGLSCFPTNEVKDWTDLLYQMLAGLQGIAECPLSDDEVDEIRQKAKEAAEYAKGFQWLPESRRPQNPYSEGTPEAHIWDQAYKGAFAQKYGSDFLRGK